MWKYKNKVINSLEDVPQNAFGFVYETVHLPSGRKYIGKKFLRFTKKLPGLKGSKRKRIVIKESDWATYYGSHEEIKRLLQEGREEEFTREILDFAYNKKHLTYLECKYQFKLGVLESKEYINDNILGKFYQRDFDFLK